MTQNQRSSMAAGVLLVLIGAAFLAAQVAPVLFGWLQVERNWPLIVIACGLLFLLIGLLTGSAGLLVPAAIIGGVGGMLYWQSITGRWESWAYTWTLIPGFVGVGVFFTRLLEGRTRAAFTEGGQAILVSLVLFAFFGTFLGGLNFPGLVLPALLIGAGLIMLVNTLFRRSE